MSQLNAGTMLLSALLFTRAAFSQTIMLSPAGGPPTSMVQVSGGGFSPGASINISFDTTDEALATANSSGSFSSVAIQVPSTA